MTCASQQHEFAETLTHVEARIEAMKQDEIARPQKVASATPRFGSEGAAA